MAFWNRNKEAAVIAAPEPITVTAQSEDELAAYATAVLSAGGDAASPFLLEAKLAHALAENGLSEYDYPKVVDYLAVKFPDGWGWVPFSTQDDFAPEADFGRRMNPMAIQEWDWRRNGWIVARGRVYTKPVPLPVLNTISVIRTAVPQIKFFISDELRPDYGDPFLMVKIPGSETCHVIERWDEPSFRG